MSKGSWREFEHDSMTKSAVQKPIPKKSERMVRVQRIKGGKGGKVVTVISGLKLEEVEAKSLLKRLKAICGTGGTVKGDLLELQGDQVTSLIFLLEKEGYHPKKSGG